MTLDFRGSWRERFVAADGDADIRPDLRGKDLTGAMLDGADLALTRLDHARLDGASLRGADLSCASLTGASFKQAILAGARLEACSAVGACFDHANLNESNLSAANFARASFRRAMFAGVTLRHTSFAGANLRGADFSFSELGQCDFEGAHLASAELMRPVDAAAAAAGYPHFAHALTLTMLLLRMRSRDALLDVDIAVEVAAASGTLDEEVGKLLADKQWRPQLVGAVAVATGGATPVTLRALWDAIVQHSWVSPQLIAAALLTDPGFTFQARRHAATLKGKTAESLAWATARAAGRNEAPTHEGERIIASWVEALERFGVAQLKREDPAAR